MKNTVKLLILAALNFDIFSCWTKPTSNSVLLTEYSRPVYFHENKGHAKIPGFTVCL